MLIDNSYQNLIREEIDKPESFVPGNSGVDALPENRKIVWGTSVVLEDFGLTFG